MIHQDLSEKAKQTQLKCLLGKLEHQDNINEYEGKWANLCLLENGESVLGDSRFENEQEALLKIEDIAKKTQEANNKGFGMLISNEEGTFKFLSPFNKPKFLKQKYPKCFTCFPIPIKEEF
jgi:hypothetical protein